MEAPRKSFASLAIPEQRKIGYLYALIHVIKGVIGVGLFALGFAVRNAGIFLGPPLVLLLGLIAVHCQHLLVKGADKMSQYADDPNAPLDYANTVELSFKTGPKCVAKWARAASRCVDTFTIITQFGFCCVYLVFIAENIQQVLIANGIDIDLRILLLIIWPPIWLVCMITNLKALAPVSMAANILISGSFIATITSAYMGQLKPISELRPYTTPWEYAIFLGTVVFSFETIALVLPVKNAMKHPEQYDPPFGVLNVGMTIVMIMYQLSGITGYWRWGEEVAGSLTLNLGETIFAQCIKTAVSLGIMFTYPLHFYVPIQVLLPYVLAKTKLVERPLLGELIFRTVMTIVTVIIAELVPSIGLFISLVGALCSTSIALVFPPLIEFLVMYKSQQSSCIRCWIIFKNTFILTLAFISFTIGSTISTLEIIKHFQNTFHQDVSDM